MAQREVIRGYSSVFNRDWRIYSVPDGKGGRKPLPFASGLPMRSIGYFAAALVVMVLLSRLPLIGGLFSFGGWPITFIGIPGLVAFALTQLEPDGRPALRFLTTAVTHRVTASTRSAGRPVRGEGVQAICDQVTAIADDASTRLPRATVHGPAIVEFRDDVVLARSRKDRHTVRPAPAGHDPDDMLAWLELDVGERLEVRP